MPRVLIVDDHEVTLSIMSAALKGLGIEEPVKATNGLRAIEEIHSASEGFDIIFCDLNMPEEDGLSFLRMLADIQSGVAVVIMSAEEKEVLDSSETIASRYGLNIVGVVEKPVTAAQLKEFIEQTKREKYQSADKDTVSMTATELAEAISGNLLCVYFQPQIDLRNRQICGLEALARINHPVEGILAPDSFIKVAEETEQIHRLTDIVIDESLKWLKLWRSEGHDITISINLSSRVLGDSGFAERLSRFAAEYDIPPQCITCELTETMLTGDVTTLLTNMTRLRMMKFKLSIDDFGTGYASLEQLHGLPFHELKIDKCFVKDFGTREKSRSILVHSLRLAKDMKLTTVAEGVETEATLKALKLLGCQVAQGYFISRPLAPEEITPLLASGLSGRTS
ncbi:two-component system response regulator [Hahella ganghwensis]|uniref:two-component system response regulator n=1 Tax=Hahella ganghwensis TaxID=286420 RepID=UPI00037E3A58|nr:EAL domain-containing response regulator [Hahella ganghwensis]